VFTIHFCIDNTENLYIIIIIGGDDLNIGSRLKDARKLRGISQDSLAEQLGFSRGVITNIERNKTVPTQLVLNGICQLLNINQEWLATGNGKIEDAQVSKSVKILSEINETAKELSVDEQLYILDLINTFKKHKEDLKK